MFIYVSNLCLSAVEKERHHEEALISSIGNGRPWLHEFAYIEYSREEIAWKPRNVVCIIIVYNLIIFKSNQLITRLLREIVIDVLNW